MFLLFNVKQYSVHYYNLKRSHIGVNLFDDNDTRQVNIWFEILDEIAGSSHVSYDMKHNYFVVFMNFNLAESVIDILRNEKPVTASVDSDKQSFSLWTGKEQVGEEETQYIFNMVVSPENVPE